MQNYFKGIFLNPCVFFKKNFDIVDNFSKPFWEDLDDTFEVVAKIEYIFKGVTININIHRISFISISDNELEKISSHENINEPDIVKLAYYIFYSFTGMLDFYFISNEDLPNQIPVESFSYDESGKIRREGASERFMYAQMINDYYDDPIEKANAFSGVLKRNWATIEIDKFLLTIDKKKKEKAFFGFDEEYYFLISSLDKNRYLAYNEGLLITGWTICEYLINFLFELNVGEDLKESRTSYFDDIDKFPFAFDSRKKELRPYKKLINKIECSAEHRLEILKNEGKFNSSDLCEKLKILRNNRNIFIHKPAKNSLEIIKVNHLMLWSKISGYIQELKEIIKIEKLK